MSAVLLTPPVLQFFDNNGDPLNGGFLYTYAAGTTTPKATYTDASGTIPAANPIVLDAAGRTVVWIDGAYKFVLTDALGNIIRTVDDVSSFTVASAATVKVSSNDTTGGYLNGKLVAGTGITLTENNNGGDETLTIATGNIDIPTPVTVRQTVLQAPVDTGGFPSFLPSTSINLNITSQNISTGLNEFIATASSGATTNRIGRTTSNLTWSGLTASSTNFLYIDIDSAGVITTGSTTLAPVYQWGGTPSITNGQFTFNIQQMQGYLGNGTAANTVYRVFVGEAVTNTTAVTSAIGYALMGRYESLSTATLPGLGTSTVRSHNIGVIPRYGVMKLICTTANGDYAVGDEIEAMVDVGSFVGFAPNYIKTRNMIRFRAGNNGIGFAGISAAGAYVALVAANWSYKFIADRGW